METDEMDGGDTFEFASDARVGSRRTRGNVQEDPSGSGSTIDHARFTRADALVQARNVFAQEKTRLQPSTDASRDVAAMAHDGWMVTADANTTVARERGSATPPRGQLKRSAAFSWPSHLEGTQLQAFHGCAADVPRSTDSSQRTSDTSASTFTSRFPKTPATVGILAARLSTTTLKGHTSIPILDEAARGSKPVQRIRKAVLRVLDNSHVTAFIIVLSAWSLFSDDIRLAATDRRADRVFEWTSIFTLVFFALEIVLESFARRGYFVGVYFWLDLLAAASLFFFIPSLVDAIFTEDSIYNTSEVKSWNVRGSEGLVLKLARVIRVSRLARILKVYQQRARSRMLSGKEERNAPGATRMGQKLSDLTALRVLVGVLAMLMVVPVLGLGGNYYGIPLFYMEGGLQGLHESQPTNCKAVPSCQLQVQEYISRSKVHLWGRETYLCYSLLLRGRDAFPEELENSGAMELRPVEKVMVQFDTSYAYFDRRWESQVEAVLDICMSLFLAVVLGLGAFFFNRDVNSLAVKPIQRMLAKIVEVSENPLQAIHKQLPLRKQSKCQYETHKLDLAISKICGLLVIGFGDAGAEIIAENMKYGGDLNPMIPGKKTVAIFGFCDIKKFTETTEVLQEEIMEFVNTVANIVHTRVISQSGSANKNMGDGFLIVWKFPDFVTAEQITNFEDAPLHVVECVQRTADKAMAAFLKIMVDLRRSRELKRFIVTHELGQHLDGPGVGMGFGLHVGWAIEGPIGSQYKVDASYLSPHVNIASRLEAATRHFKVPILFSDAFQRLLPKNVQEKVRQVDCLTVKGSSVPLAVYTYDIDLQTFCHSGKDHASSNQTMHLEQQLPTADLPRLYRSFHHEFRTSLQLYIAGQWKTAKDHLERAHKHYASIMGEGKTDGPSDALLETMSMHNFEAPHGWRGHRKLINK
uniref:Guanylate cyclase domain-containing protein n=1 Tax=Picocystis salinarum TaxID=88271 RepID=A0A7S3UF09_9CHLO